MTPNWVRLCSMPKLLSHADLDMDAKRIYYIWHQYFQARPLAETFIIINQRRSVLHPVLFVLLRSSILSKHRHLLSFVLKLSVFFLASAS